MLVPTIYKINVKVPNKDTGLMEVQEVERLAYYQSNNNPFDHCKTCKAKAKEARAKDPEAKVVMNFRRNGSAYCEGCAEEYKGSTLI